MLSDKQYKPSKTHMISGLCCTDSKWPLQLQEQPAEQGLITLNLCRISRKHPDKSAYYSYHNKCCNWKKYLMAPPGTRAVIHQTPDNRTSWGPRELNAWCCGPAFDHYCNMNLFVLETNITVLHHHLIYSHSIVSCLH